VARRAQQAQQMGAARPAIARPEALDRDLDPVETEKTREQGTFPVPLGATTTARTRPAAVSRSTCQCGAFPGLR
jgi:hypothetical protein